MGKQPYIPFYVGDYLKDTRVLPLSVRGAWVDIILFMWDAPVRGEIVGTMEDFARMMSCTIQEAEFALNLLKQKSTADFVLLEHGEIKIISRKMKRDYEISKKRSKAGKKGVEAKFANGFAEANAKAKVKQNTEYDTDNEYEYEKNKKESNKKPDFTLPDIPGDTVVMPFETEPMRRLWATWKEARWNNHGVRYRMDGEQADLRRMQGMTFKQVEETIQQAVAAGWKNLYPEKNGTPTSKKRKESTEDLIASFAERVRKRNEGG